MSYTVYMHRNKINGKKYIGATSSPVEKRWSNGQGYRHNQMFFKDIQTYGWGSFDHVILKSGLTKKEASSLEFLFVNMFHSDNPKHGYNIASGGFSGFTMPDSQCRKRVRQYTLDGEYIAEYRSVSEAAEITGINIGTISGVASGKTKNPRAFRWYYADKD